MEFSKVGLRKFIDLDKWGISSFGLKIIAAVTMIIDHCGVLFAADNRLLYLIMRSIGRISFPIFCFLLVEGFFHTRNKVKHVMNLVVFATISEVPYDMFKGSFFDTGKQNVIFTLLVGFLVIWAFDNILNVTDKETGQRIKRTDTNIFDMIIILIVMGVGFAITHILNSTYTFGGVLLIIFFYVAYNKPIGRIASNIFFNVGLYSMGVQWLGALSSIIIEFYNGKLGARKWKYFFYIFYPGHLLILSIIKYFIIK